MALAKLKSRAPKSQGKSWCSFLKNSPETSRSQIYFGACYSSFSFKKPESVPNCPPIFWGSILWIRAWKVLLEAEHSLVIFFQASNWTHILLTSQLARFLQCFHNYGSCHLMVKACQISLDYWLFTWMNLKRCSFATTKYNLLWSKWVIYLGFHRS